MGAHGWMQADPDRVAHLPGVAAWPKCLRIKQCVLRIHYLRGAFGAWCVKNGNSIRCKICFVEDGDTSPSRPENFLLVFSQESCGVFRVGWEVHILQSVGVWARADSPRLSTATESYPADCAGQRCGVSSCVVISCYMPRSQAGWTSPQI